MTGAQLLRRAGRTGAAALVAAVVSTAPAVAEAPILIDEMPPVHRIALDPGASDRLIVATHAGLYRAAADGSARLVSEAGEDLISLAPVPGASGAFVAGGRSALGENLGLLRSDDGGQTWTRVGDGAKGPAAFYALDVSPADSKTIYGLGLKQGFQASHDGGRTWSAYTVPTGPVYDIAASTVDPARVYAATRNGLMVSRDGGETWQAAYPRPRRPATAVEVAPDGRLYAFVWREGLVMAKDEAEDGALSWTVVANDFVDRLLIDIAADPARPQWIYGLADTGALMASDDGGRSWTTFEGSGAGRKAAIARGEALYRDTCQACHGVRAVGERPDDMYARDEFGFVAPPLDNSAHGWHHSDSDLVATILNGSPRNERMRGWKDEMTEAQARDIVAYIKSLWNFRSLACQGPRHMICNQQQQ